MQFQSGVAYKKVLLIKKCYLQKSVAYKKVLLIKESVKFLKSLIWGKRKWFAA